MVNQHTKLKVIFSTQVTHTHTGPIVLPRPVVSNKVSPQWRRNDRYAPDGGSDSPWSHFGPFRWYQWLPQM